MYTYMMDIEGYVRIHVYIYICIYVYIYMYSTYTHIYIYVERAQLTPQEMMPDIAKELIHSDAYRGGDVVVMPAKGGSIKQSHLVS